MTGHTDSTPTPSSFNYGFSPISFPERSMPPPSSYPSSLRPPAMPTLYPSRVDYMSASGAQPSFSMPSRASIDYPHHILRPPPAAASPSTDRQDQRTLSGHAVMGLKDPMGPLTIPSNITITYWLDDQVGTSGLKNLGNTCYMNATIQCLNATVPFARFFTGE
jgi:ubiquitin carboxyl-terminal hydrolase 8